MINERGIKLHVLECCLGGFVGALKGNKTLINSGRSNMILSKKYEAFLPTESHETVCSLGMLEEVKIGNAAALLFFKMTRILTKK